MAGINESRSCTQMRVDNIRLRINRHQDVYSRPKNWRRLMSGINEKYEGQYCIGPRVDAEYVGYSMLIIRRFDRAYEWQLTPRIHDIRSEYKGEPGTEYGRCYVSKKEIRYLILMRLSTPHSRARTDIPYVRNRMIASKNAVTGGSCVNWDKIWKRTQQNSQIYLP